MGFDDIVLLVLAVGTIIGAGLVGARKGLKEFAITLACILVGAGLGYFVDGTRAATVVMGAVGAIGPLIYRKVAKAVQLVKVARLLKK